MIGRGTHRVGRALTLFVPTASRGHGRCSIARHDEITIVPAEESSKPCLRIEGRIVGDEAAELSERFRLEAQR